MVTCVGSILLVNFKWWMENIELISAGKNGVLVQREKKKIGEVWAIFIHWDRISQDTFFQGKWLIIGNHLFMFSLATGFLNTHRWHVGPDSYSRLLCPVDCRMLIITLGLCSLDASGSFLHPSLPQLWQLKMSPDTARHLLAGKIGPIWEPVE